MTSYDNPTDPYGGPFTDPAPPSARQSLVLSIRRAVDAARQIDDPFSPGYQTPGQNGAADIRAMSSLIMQATRRVRELLLDPDAGPPRFGTIGLMVKESGSTKEEEQALLDLLRDALEIPDFETRCAAAMQQILEGALPRIAGLTRDDEDDDELTPAEEAEQLVVTAMNAREALARISVAITEEQSFDFVRHFWALIDEYNAKMTAEEEAAHAAGVKAAAEELRAAGAEVHEYRREDAPIPSFEERAGNEYSAALQMALAELGVQLDGETCKAAIVRALGIKARGMRPVADDGADAEG